MAASPGDYLTKAEHARLLDARAACASYEAAAELARRLGAAEREAAAKLGDAERAAAVRLASREAELQKAAAVQVAQVISHWLCMHTLAGISHRALEGFSHAVQHDWPRCKRRMLVCRMCC